MKKNEIEEKLKQILKEKFNTSFDMDLNLIDRGFSSTDLLILFMELEKSFEILFSDDFINARTLLNMEQTINYIYNAHNSA